MTITLLCPILRLSVTETFRGSGPRAVRHASVSKTGTAIPLRSGLIHDQVMFRNVDPVRRGLFRVEARLPQGTLRPSASQQERRGIANIRKRCNLKYDGGITANMAC